MLASGLSWVGIFAAVRFATRNVPIVGEHFTLVALGIVALSLLSLAIVVPRSGRPAARPEPSPASDHLPVWSSSRRVIAVHNAVAKTVTRAVVGAGAREPRMLAFEPTNPLPPSLGRPGRGAPRHGQPHRSLSPSGPPPGRVHRHVRSLGVRASL